MPLAKKIVIGVAAILLLSLVLGVAAGLYLSDDAISGFTGLAGIVRMDADDVYVPLTDNPQQLLIRREDAFGVFEEFYFDSVTDTGGYYVLGSGQKDGQPYEYAMRAFTRYYYIVTLHPVDNS